MNEFGADFDGFVQHLSHTLSDVGIIHVANAAEGLNELEGIPCMALHISGKRFDGRTGVPNIVHCHDSPAWQGHQVERVIGKRQQRIQQM